MLLALGIDKLLRQANTRQIGWGVLFACAVASCWTAAQMSQAARGSIFRLRDAELVRSLVQTNDPSQVLACVGHRYMTLEYYSQRYGFQGELVAFPRDVKEHPGLYFGYAKRYVKDPATLPREGQIVGRQLLDMLRQGRPLWIADNRPFGDRNGDFLYAELTPFVRAIPISRPNHLLAVRVVLNEDARPDFPAPMSSPASATPAESTSQE